MIKKLLGQIYLKTDGNNRLERIWKLAQIDFKKRYYNDKLGVLWALLNPVLQVGLYYIVFKEVINRGEDDFALFLFVGLVMWTTFMLGTKQGINIFKMKRYLIENIQFNKIDLFLSHILNVFMSWCFTIAAYFVIAIIYGIKFDVFYMLGILIFLVFLVFLLILGSCLILSTFSIFLKDIHHIWDFALLCGFWTTGIFFPAAKILEYLPIIKYANPMLGIVENSRRILMYNTTIDWNLMTVNIVQAFIVLGLGLFVFYNYSGKAIEKL